MEAVLLSSLDKWTIKVAAAKHLHISIFHAFALTTLSTHVHICVIGIT